MARKRKTPSRQRNYVGTWNNYPEDWEQKYTLLFKTGKFKYIVGGQEVGEEKKTPHIQTHFDLNNAMSLNALHAVLNKNGIQMGLKPCLGKEHAANNRDYCMKDGDFKEWGEAPAQGKRNDLEHFMESIRQEPMMKRRKMFEEHTSVMARYPKFAEEYKSLVMELPIYSWKRNPDGDPPNEWWYGAPGSGKSSYWQALLPYLKDKSTEWWDGYDYHETVLIEDVDESTPSKILSRLKEWADRYPVEVQIKGAYRRINPPRIVITSNYHPEELNLKPRVLEAIMQRFTIRLCTKGHNFRPKKLGEDFYARVE